MHPDASEIDTGQRLSELNGASILTKLVVWMQEKLPLRPAEFVKIRDGFIAFLKQPAGTPIELVVPEAVLEAMASAARRGRGRRRMLDLVRGVSILVAAAGAILGLIMEP
jgi:hypothetical protein